ncbi:MarR family transcriptional regulator, transcriptional regulator for hemolysin [Amycolatopsis pretoriensis]|uniref:MarR family transcriptional regulator, transcriptional regulator for hemolysin n=1 Tax=Amycolatopsis pretoriensis TaxID=218821 RepID=A0A1H5Q6U7_9PSEU|nr:MarR family winged helix-turn-helix transcriptional regulator [Amycolatopsis pretoriensis]SEF21850.1 MarR family transcriptional regulator, transcriptional regulator for hemolysin [Amycolatopsis pretoriensis]
MPAPATTPIGVVLARTAKTAGRAFDQALATAGGSQPVWQILISLKTRPVANQRELADAVGIQGATLTHHLNGMETAGLVTRRRDPENRRVHLVTLTPEGEQLFLRLATASIAHDERMRKGLSDTEITQLADLLHRLAANVSDT